jgi:hypothetical protein
VNPDSAQAAAVRALVRATEAQIALKALAMALADVRYTSPELYAALGNVGSAFQNLNEAIARMNDPPFSGKSKN